MALILDTVPLYASIDRSDRDHERCRLDDVANGAYVVEDLVATDYRRIRDPSDRYADAGIGYVDAAVLAIAERLDEPKLATLDHCHFVTLRPGHVEALRLLPE